MSTVTIPQTYPHLQLLHEVRHWAQIAAAVRMAGCTPPGDHDLFYAKALL
jgi:uncharacterized damage-inducible protein DinB